MRMLMQTYRNYIMWALDCILVRHIYKIECDFLKPIERWGDYIYETLFASVKRKRVTVQKGVFIESVANIKRITFQGSSVPYEIPFFIRFSEPKPIPFRVPSESYKFAYSVISTDDLLHIILCDHPVWYGLRDAVIAYNEKRKNFEKKCADFHNFVDRLCGYYDTVEEAVAAWPALKFLLPEELQSQDFSFDGTPKPLPEDVGIAEITAMITRAKMEV